MAITNEHFVIDKPALATVQITGDTTNVHKKPYQKINELIKANYFGNSFNLTYKDEVTEKLYKAKLTYKQSELNNFICNNSDLNLVIILLKS